MAYQACPHCGELTTTNRSHCISCDLRLPPDFGILLQPNPNGDPDIMLRTTLLREGKQAAIRHWLELNANGSLKEATAHIQRLISALSSKQHPPAD